MATAAKQIATKPERVKNRVVDFSAESLKAPFFLRCAALFIDYMILLTLPITWLVAGRLFGEAGATPAIGTTIWFLSIVLVLANLIGLPFLRGQSIGKMVTGLTILKTDGSHPDLAAIVLRNIVGYMVTILTFGIGFFVAAFNRRGRALHDAIGGTVVIRGRRTQT